VDIVTMYEITIEKVRSMDRTKATTTAAVVLGLFVLGVVFVPDAAHRIGNYAARVQQVIPLEYREVIPNQQVHPLNEEGIEVILQEQETANGTVLLYMKEMEPQIIYAGYIANNDTAYDLGSVGASQHLSTMKIIHNPITTIRELIRFEGAYGQATPQSNYFIIQPDRVEPFIRIDGQVVELDLDEDGTEEIIATGDLSPITTVYKVTGGSITAANINQALGAETVKLRQNEPIFEVYFKKQRNKVRLYRLTSLGMIEIPES
jgi:hypothetical protein